MSPKKTGNEDIICKNNPKSEDSPARRNRNRTRWSKKRRRSSTPTPLQLHGDCNTPILTESDDLSKEQYDGSSQHNDRSSPVPWTSEQHRAFVNAVFEVGMAESSPAVIAEQMITKNDYNTLNTNQADFFAQKDEMKTTQLPEEAEYYKKELTGERLKSHLQKMRKQKPREKEIFLGDYNRYLNRQEILDQEEKEVQKIKEQRKEEARRRRQRRKRSMSAIFEVMTDERPHDDITKEEEERLLSLYLPLRSKTNTNKNGSSDLNEDFDSDCQFDENAESSVFPAGGRAIGMLTWAVRKQEIEDRKKRKEKHRLLALQKEKEQERRRQQAPTPDGWETASVDSWTSHTAIAAGKFVKNLGPGRRGPATSMVEERPLDCASSEDDDTDTDDSEDGELDQFRAGLPTLTKAELNSPLGVSLRLTWDMIKHMHGVIAEERASKIKEKELQRQARAQRLQEKKAEQFSAIKIQSSVEESSTENETLPETSKLEGEPTFTATTNPQLLVAMAANGAPPATLVQALGGAGLGELGTPLLLSAFLSSNPSIVTPLPQSTLEQISGFQAPPAVALQNPYSSYNKQGSAFAARTATIPTAKQRPTLGVFKPLVAPKDSWLGLQNSFSSPDSRPRSPMVSLSTPTTPAEAMFRSLLQQNQQSEEQQYPV